MGAGALAVMMPGWSSAEEPPVLSSFPPACWITEGATTKVYLRGCNDTGGTLTGVTPSPLEIVTTGTASVTMLTMPTFRRTLVDHNCVNFQWQFRIDGCGTVSFSDDITAEDEDGVTWSTGEVFCGQVVADGAQCRTVTATPTRTAVAPPTLAPSRTRIPSPTPKPGKEVATLRPTRTPLSTATPRTRLNTPTPKPAKEVATLRPTRTPLLTATPRPRLPSPTPKPPKVKATLRPTRTPIPTRTQGPVNAALFEARCIALPAHGEQVTVYLQLFNNTGADLYNVVPNPIEVDVTGTVKLTHLIGPTPRLLRVLTNRHSGRFEWYTTATGEGQIFIHVSATAVTPEGREVVFDGTGGGADGVVISTNRVECNTLNVPPRVQK